MHSRLQCQVRVPERADARQQKGSATSSCSISMDVPGILQNLLDTHLAPLPTASAAKRPTGRSELRYGHTKEASLAGRPSLHGPAAISLVKIASAGRVWTPKALSSESEAWPVQLCDGSTMRLHDGIWRQRACTLMLVRHQRFARRALAAAGRCGRRLWKTSS